MMENISVVTPRKSKRYETVDVAKAIAIILVVIGHFREPAMPELYHDIIKVIYMFHMPLFMIASGFLFMATYRPGSYGSFVWKKFKRLMVPYFVTSVLIITIKLLGSSSAELQNPVTTFSYLGMFYLPSAGYFLWFVWALWWMMLIMPWFTAPKMKLFLFAVSLILAFVWESMPDVFCIKEFCRMLVYFVSGILLYDINKKSPLPSLPLGFAVLFLVCASLVVCGIDLTMPAWARTVLGLAGAFTGSAFVFSLSRFVASHGTRMLKSAAMSVASASYIIYLFHTTFEGFAKGLLHKLHFFSGNLMIKYAVAEVIVVGAGVILPYLMARYVLNRFAVTRALFGLSR